MDKAATGQIYFYKLTHDSGGAPCVQRGMLSLAICKPMIRSTAKVDDLIFGFAANSLHADNRLVYVARVTDKRCIGEYFKQRRFAHRGDCVYEWRDGRFCWRPGARHHGPEHLKHDLGPHPHYQRANVLLSGDFRYFGGDGNADYKRKYSRVRDAVEHLGQGHRLKYGGQLREELIALKHELWRSIRETVVGSPTSGSRRGSCHRSRSCVVLEERSKL